MHFNLTGLNQASLEGWESFGISQFDFDSKQSQFKAIPDSIQEGVAKDGMKAEYSVYKIMSFLD